MNQVFYLFKAFYVIVRRKILSGGYSKYARILVVMDPEEVYISDFADAIPFYAVNYPLHYGGAHLSIKEYPGGFLEKSIRPVDDHKKAHNPRE